MSWLTTLALYLIHGLFSTLSLLASIPRRLRQKPPQPLNATRRQIPTHLALLLVPDEREDSEQLEGTLVDIALRVIKWCRVVGVNRLTIYDRQGRLAGLSLNIKERVCAPEEDCSDDSSAESEIEYPLTPPLTDESRSISPDLDVLPDLNISTVNLSARRVPTRSSVRNVVKRRGSRKEKTVPQDAPVTLHLASRTSGKQAVADLAAFFLQRHLSKKTSETFTCSIEDLTSALQGDHGFPAPDLMIVHDMSKSSTLELHGFPPWQIRLTEIYYFRKRPSWRWSNPPVLSDSFTELDFRRALDEYAAAEMRLGK